MLLLWERGKSCQKHRADTIHAEGRRRTARLGFQALQPPLFPVGIYANHPRSNLGHGWTLLLLVMIPPHEPTGILEGAYSPAYSRDSDFCNSVVLRRPSTGGGS